MSECENKDGGTSCHYQPPKQESDKPIQKYWRPACVVVYLAICLFDFVAMPIYIENQAKHTDIAEYFDQVERFNGNPSAQTEILRSVKMKPARWEPITLGGSAAFHFAFGAIIGASAWTRGKEKESRMR